jgi:DNA polymerase-3 subunit delta'
VSLKDIIGQKKAVETLSGIVGRQRVASSYLFCGEPGIGKKTVAINFAKILNCSTPHSSPVAGFDACDACQSCIKIDAGVHPDVLLVSPEERQIRIEEIRLVDEGLSFKPYEGRKKVVIIDDAEAMTISAANAFLKTLEEPPEDSVIVLVSSKPDVLPPTIRSRCSRINFAPLPVESCREVLEKKVSNKNSELLARLSLGRPGVALSTDLLEERTWFLNLLSGMLKAEKDSWTSREDMERWFGYALAFFRDIAVLKVTGAPSRLINPDLEAYLAGLHKSLDLHVIIDIYGKLSKVKGLLMFNLNKSITWNYTASLLRKEISSQNA